MGWVGLGRVSRNAPLNGNNSPLVVAWPAVSWHTGVASFIFLYPPGLSDCFEPCSFISTAKPAFYGYFSCGVSRAENESHLPCSACNIKALRFISYVRICVQAHSVCVNFYGCVELGITLMVTVSRYNGYKRVKYAVGSRTQCAYYCSVRLRGQHTIDLGSRHWSVEYNKQSYLTKKHTYCQNAMSRIHRWLLEKYIHDNARKSDRQEKKGKLWRPQRRINLKSFKQILDNIFAEINVHPEISAHQKQWFSKGGVHKTDEVMMGDFSKGGSTQNRWGVDGWFFKGGSTWNRSGFWWVLDCFLIDSKN